MRHNFVNFVIRRQVKVGIMHNVNKYDFMIMIFFLLCKCIKNMKKKRKKIRNETYFYYACVKYDLIGYMTSTRRDE